MVYRYINLFPTYYKFVFFLQSLIQLNVSFVDFYLIFFKYHCYYLLASHQSFDATSVLTRAWWDTNLIVDLKVLISYGLFSN